MSELEMDILAEIILYARDRLSLGRYLTDHEMLIQFRRVLDRLEDVCIEKNYLPLAQLSSHISLLISDSLMGVNTFSYLPSESEILDALSETRKLTGDDS